jgi:hypothetical protein
MPDPASLIDHLMTQPLSERVPDDIAKLFELREARCATARPGDFFTGQSVRESVSRR